MTTTTLDTTASTAGDQSMRAIRRSPWRRLALPTRSNGFPIVIWTVVLRGIVLVADYLLAFVTAVGLIPTVGVWLHRESGAAQGSLTGAGTIAMWVVPLVFLVALLTAGELAVMRGMWRWSGRKIQRIRDSRTSQDTQTQPVNRRNRTTSKRSK